MSGLTSRQQYAMTPTQLADVEEVEFFNSLGHSPERICQAIGKSPSALARSLQRAGRPELARPFLHKWARGTQGYRKTKHCPECGTDIWPGSALCRPCELVRRWG